MRKSGAVLALVFARVFLELSAVSAVPTDFTTGTIPLAETSPLERERFKAVAEKNGLKALLVPNSALVSSFKNGGEYGFLVDQIRILDTAKQEITYLFFSGVEKLVSSAGRGNEMAFLDFQITDSRSVLVRYKMTDNRVGTFLYSVDQKRVIGP